MNGQSASQRGSLGVHSPSSLSQAPIISAQIRFYGGLASADPCPGVDGLYCPLASQSWCVIDDGAHFTELTQPYSSLEDGEEKRETGVFLRVVLTAFKPVWDLRVHSGFYFPGEFGGSSHE